MELVFRTRERGIEFERGVRELDPRDHESILWSFSRVLDLHRELGKREPALSTIEYYRQEGRTTWLVDDVGMIFSVIDRPTRASVHIVFWDRRLRGREILCRGIADYIIHRWRLDYICTMVPEASKATLAFCKRVGFEEAARVVGEVHLVYTTEVVSP